MQRSEILNRIIDIGVIAVIRLKDKNHLYNVVNALVEGGVKCIEITMTVPDADKIIFELNKNFSNSIILGAGTVTKSEDAKLLISKGAKFIVSPIFDQEIIKVCNDADVVCMPGCFTPTEIFNAWRYGADMIKVFPATSLGPRYIKDLLAPFPDLKLIPTGGVTIENSADWILAGAVAVGIGSNLFDPKLIAENKYSEITECAKRLVENITVARKKLVKQ